MVGADCKETPGVGVSVGQVGAPRSPSGIKAPQAGRRSGGGGTVSHGKGGPFLSPIRWMGEDHLRSAVGASRVMWRALNLRCLPHYGACDGANKLMKTVGHVPGTFPSPYRRSLQRGHLSYVGARVPFIPSTPSHKGLTWQKASSPCLAAWCPAPGLAARGGNTSPASPAACQAPGFPLYLGKEEALQSSPVGSAFEPGSGQQGPLPVPLLTLCFSATFLCQAEKALDADLLITRN